MQVVVRFVVLVPAHVGAMVDSLLLWSIGVWCVVIWGLAVGWDGRGGGGKVSPHKPRTRTLDALPRLQEASRPSTSSDLCLLAAATIHKQGPW